MSDEGKITDLYLSEITEAFENLDIQDIEFEHRRYAEFGDEDAREKLIIRAAPLVLALLRKLGVSREIRDDAIQAGNLAVIQAVDSWDRRRGYSFTSWATYKAMLGMIREVEKLTGSPLPIDLATAEWLCTREDDGPGEITLDFGGASLTIPQDNDGNSNLEQAVLSEQLRDAINHVLTDKQRKTLVHILNGMPFRDIADKLGVSPAAVSLMYKGIIVKLKNFLNPET